jgi:hypothetical protein
MRTQSAWKAGRRTRLAAWGLLAGIGLAAAGTSGCNLVKAAAYFAQPSTEKVAPEFNRLPGKKVVIYVWSYPDILWEYDKLRLDISANLASYLQKNVKDVRVEDPIQVERWVEKQDIKSLDPVEVGRHFKSDMVIHISIHKFSLRDPEMAHFFRGKIGASVQVHDLSKPEEAERINVRDVNVVAPEKGPVGIENATAAEIRVQTYDAFTVEVGRKFHQWEREVNK